MTSEIIGSIVAFVLNSALFSSFIIPQVQSLKSLKDQLFQFRLSPDSADYRSESPAKLQNLLDQYRVRSAELQATTNKFYLSVSLALVCLILATYWGHGRDFILSVHPILQLGVTLWALRSYAAAPDQVSSPLYLVRECDINPHLMVGAMGLGITFNSVDYAKADWRTPLSIDLSVRLRIYGYRFMFIVTNNDGSRVYYASYGPITPKTRSFRTVLDPSHGISELNRISLGEFAFNQFETPTDLRVYFLLFIPYFENEVVNPMLTSGSMEGRNRNNIVLASSGLGAARSDRVYPAIKFSGDGPKIKSLEIEDLPRANNPVVNRVMRKLRLDFMRARKIESITDLNGLIAAD